MKAIIKTKRFDINLKSQDVTYYTAVADSEERVLELLEEELSKEIDASVPYGAYTVEDFEIEYMGMATYNGTPLEESFICEM